VEISAPEPIRTSHQIGDFTSGVVSLDAWLKRRALANQASSAPRTFVVCDADKVVGYFALASGAVHVATAPGRIRRNMPEPIAVVVLARLAVDRSYQGRSLGRALVRDAARHVVKCRRSDQHPWYSRARNLG
jgi:ribosomal protein S18 acetylase RimI-like enzyme